MITKNASKYFTGNACYTAKLVKGFNTGVFEITIDENTTVNLGFYGTKDGSVPTSSSGQLTVFKDGLQLSSITIDKAGTYKFVIDFAGYTKILLSRNVASGSIVSQDLYLSQEDINYYKSDFGFINRTSFIDTTNARALVLDVNLLENGYVFARNEGDYINLYIDGLEVNDVGYLLDAGHYSAYVDCRYVNKVELGCSSSAEIKVQCSKDDYDYTSLVDKNKLSTLNNIVNFGSGKQLEFDFISYVQAYGSQVITLQGSNDGFSEDINTIPVLNSKNMPSDKMNPLGTDSYFANIEGYSEVRLYCDFKGNKSTRLVIGNIKVHSDYKEGKIFGSWGDVSKPFIKGYKFFKVNFKDSYKRNALITSNVQLCTAYLRFAKSVEGSTVYIPASDITYYDRSMKIVNYPTIENSSYGWCLYGTPKGGGFIMELKDAIAENVFLQAAAVNTITGYSKTVSWEVECYTKAPEGEIINKLIAEKSDYNVYELPSKTANRDVLNNDVVEWEGNSITFWHGGYAGVKYEVEMNAGTAAHFVSGETINFIYLLPYRGYERRNYNNGIELLPSRMAVFTNTRVFHNFPTRGSSVGGPSSDALLFDESIIKTFDKKWYPVNDKTKVDSTHKYFPVLADYDYNQFEGRIGTSGANDPYGNGGLPSGIKLQDIPMTGIKYWNRLSYSSMTKFAKYCAFGNYNAEIGGEPFVIMTTNGGQIWTVKKSFGCTDCYNYMRGGGIDLSPISDVAAFVTNSLKMHRRKFVVPTNESKEPTGKFILDEGSLVTSFTIDSDGDCLVTLADDVDYDGVYNIVYFENVNANSEWDYICNAVNATGTINDGIYFRAKKVTANTYKLFGDVGNAYTEDQCRHIHAVNAVEAGCLISTGESYADNWFEGGFLYLIEANRNDGGTTSDASYQSVFSNIIRLCSSASGVNRACGAYVLQTDFDPTLIYASDEAYVTKDNHKRYFPLTGRTVEYPATPAGVFVGKLSDIDDQTKFKCVCPVNKTLVGLIQTHGHFAADGHEDSICFSKNGFDWNIDIYDSSKINGTDNNGNIYFGNKVIEFK